MMTHDHPRGRSGQATRRRRIAIVLGGLIAGLAVMTNAADLDHAGPPVARIGAKPVTRGELDARTDDELDAIRKRYARRRAELDLAERQARRDTLTQAVLRFVNAQVLDLEATATHRSREALLAAARPSPPTDEEVRRAYAEHARDINRPLTEVETEMRAALERDRATRAVDAYYQRLRAKYDAHVLVEPVRLTVAASGPAIGPETARVTIVLFSDLEGPYCRKMLLSLREVRDRYPNDVRLFYRHLPLTGLHAHAMSAAEAAFCADRQGQFWPYIDRLFADQRELGETLYGNLAVSLGMDLTAFARCRDNREGRSVIEADRAEAETIGVHGTPAVFLNGRLVDHYVASGELGRMIDEELSGQ